MPAAVATMLSQQHAAGIFANRNLDGPEIGTLVVIIDRAKNLPNLRTMGKQNPYCAARLGKMALKTETDQRGGQTPKWDQELRFTVHESLDYQKLKVSVFNEDKRTDLVGETWVDLEHVLRRGGGQNDAWHELHNRGKYAGQVRIELTFYDLRPREEKSAAVETAPPAQPVTSTTTQDPPRQMRGPRGPAIKRKEAPQDTTQQQQTESARQPGAIPLPQQELRSFHTPPRVGSLADMGAEYQANQHYAPDEDVDHSYQDQHPQQSLADQYDYSEYDPTAQHDEQSYVDGYGEPQPEYAGVEEHDFAFPDDPQALEAAHVDTHYSMADQGFPPRQIDRIQHLSRPVPLPQSSSEPNLHPHEHYTNPQQPPRPAQGARLSQGSPSAMPPINYAQRQMGPARGHAYRHSAPPPPSHRDRAPHSDPAVYTRNAGWDHRPPQHMTRPRQDVYRNNQPYESAPAPNFDQHDPYADGDGQFVQDAMPVPRRRSANVYPVMDDRDAYGDAPPPNQGYQRRPSRGYEEDGYDSQPILPYTSVAPRRQSYEPPRQEPHEQEPQFYSSGAGPQIVKPRAISPNAPHNRQAIRRKSVNRDGLDGGMPFSPDSFNAYNPHAAPAPAPAAPMPDQRPVSTYDRYSAGGAQPATPPQPYHQQASAMHERQSPSSVPVPEPGTPIRDSAGKLVDPSDHLPPSTHAPEPEKRGADRHRATITATVKTRFGPREARPAHIATTRTAGYASPAHTPSPLASAAATPPAGMPASSPHSPQQHLPPQAQQASPLQQREAMAAAARQRLQKRGSPMAPSTTGPLAPSAPGLLNQGAAPGYRVNGGYAQPPPVPQKIPLDDGPGEFADVAGDVARLELGERSPLQALEARYGGTGGQRARRSRFGA